MLHTFSTAVADEIERLLVVVRDAAWALEEKSHLERTSVKAILDASYRARDLIEPHTSKGDDDD